MLWKCSTCGFLHEGNESPEKCRKCGGTKEKFYALTSDDAKKIYAPDRTNDIYMEIVNLAMRINEIAKEGIEINLDSKCAELFKQLQEEAWMIKVKCKAEMANHVGDGKW